MALDHAVTLLGPALLRQNTVANEHPESRLINEFPLLVGSLMLDHVAVECKRRDNNGLDTIGDFRLVPIIPTRHEPTSLSESEFFNKTHRNIKVTFPRVNGSGNPNLDTRQAIGLTHTSTEYGERLVAVAGAGIANIGQETTLKIVQIQNVSGINHTSPELFKRIFKSGLEWRQTLVASWEAVGDAIGVDYMSIQALHNNHWVKTRANKSASTYDDVARQRSYRQEPVSGDWYKPVTEIEPTPRSHIGLRQRIGAIMLAIR